MADLKKSQEAFFGAIEAMNKKETFINSDPELNKSLLKDRVLAEMKHLFTAVDAKDSKGIAKATVNMSNYCMCLAISMGKIDVNGPEIIAAK